MAADSDDGVPSVPTPSDGERLPKSGPRSLRGPMEGKASGW